MEVRSFKLIDGTELIAELVTNAVQEGAFGQPKTVIRRPLVVMPMRGPKGETSLGFALWSMITDPDEEVTLYHHAMLRSPCSVGEELARSYIEQTSGLALPPTANTLLG